MQKVLKLYTPSCSAELISSESTSSTPDSSDDDLVTFISFFSFSPSAWISTRKELSWTIIQHFQGLSDYARSITTKKNYASKVKLTCFAFFLGFFLVIFVRFRDIPDIILRVHFLNLLRINTVEYI